MSAISLSVRGFLIAVIFAAASPFAVPQSNQPGCEPWTKTKNVLENNQAFVISGGSCGGLVTLYINLKGKSQFFNDDGNPQVGVRAYADTTTLPVDDNTKPNDGPYELNLCKGQPRAFDQKFNDFDVVCSVQMPVSTGQTRSFLLNYWTNRVSNNPLPTMHTSVRYEPAQAGSRK
jgi:hypothetical protein